MAITPAHRIIPPMKEAASKCCLVDEAGEVGCVVEVTGTAVEDPLTTEALLVDGAGVKEVVTSGRMVVVAEEVVVVVTCFSVVVSVVLPFVDTSVDGSVAVDVEFSSFTAAMKRRERERKVSLEIFL